MNHILADLVLFESGSVRFQLLLRRQILPNIAVVLCGENFLLNSLNLAGASCESVQCKKVYPTRTVSMTFPPFKRVTYLSNLAMCNHTVT